MMGKRHIVSASKSITFSPKVKLSTSKAFNIKNTVSYLIEELDNLYSLPADRLFSGEAEVLDITPQKITLRTRFTPYYICVDSDKVDKLNRHLEVEGVYEIKTFPFDYKRDLLDALQQYAVPVAYQTKPISLKISNIP